MELKDMLTSKQKLNMATKLEIIFDKTFATKVLGLNIGQYNKYSLRPMTPAEFKNFKGVNNGI